MRCKASRTLPLFFIAVLLTACSNFTAHYDAKRYQNLIELKAMHLYFLENWSQSKKNDDETLFRPEPTQREWKLDNTVNYCEQGHQKFRTAYEYARANDKNDQTGKKAIEILWKQFSGHCELSLKEQKLFSAFFASRAIKATETNYNLALEGEVSRMTSQ